MNESLEIGDFETIKSLSMADLKQLWREQSGRQAKGQEPPRVRAVLVRDLAWSAQQGRRRGLNDETQRLLNMAIRQAEHQTAEPRDSPVPRKRKPQTAKPQLQAGVTLVRKWRGKTYKVKVVDGGKGKKRYEFVGQEYRSLTTIAQEITGAHWSGPRFFGLNRVRSTG